ncbi:MAG: hypothetical protein ACRCS0_00220, partial [Albidovulum sp.]
DLDKPRFDKPKFDRPERRERSEKPAYAPKPPRVVEDEAAPAPRRAEDSRPKPKYEDRPRPAPREARPEWKEKREERPYQRREDGDRPRPAAKSYAERAPRPDASATDDSSRKPRWSPDQKSAPRSTGFKSHGGPADKPGRAGGYKSHASEGTGFRPKSEGYKPRSEGAKPREEGYKPRAEGYKPRAEGYKPREESADRPARKPYAGKGDDARPFVKRDGAGKPGGFKGAAGGAKKPYEKKPYDKAGAAPAARPAKPKADAKDTSKRFVPPKGPKR